MIKIFFLNTKSSWDHEDDRIIQLSYNFWYYYKEDNSFKEIRVVNKYVNVHWNLSSYSFDNYWIKKEDIENSDYFEKIIFELLFFLSQADYIVWFNNKLQLLQLSNEIKNCNFDFWFSEKWRDLLDMISGKDLNNNIHTLSDLYKSLFPWELWVSYWEASIISKCFFKVYPTSDSVYGCLSSKDLYVGQPEVVECDETTDIIKNSIYSDLLNDYSNDPNSDKYNPEALNFIKLVAQWKKHIFLTWKAWTWKSTLIKSVIKAAKKNWKLPVILWSTWIAAMNIWWQTAHSFFWLWVEQIYYSDMLNIVRNNPDRKKFRITKARRELLRNAPFVIIDEVSMLHSNVIDCINALMTYQFQWEWVDWLSFWWKQIIFVWDIFQLPPVKNSEWSKIFKYKYNSQWFFDSHTFKNTISDPIFSENTFSYRVVELKKNYRIIDHSDLVNILNDIRFWTITDWDVQVLNSRVSSFIDPDSTFLASLKTTADRINKERLEALPWDEYVFKSSETKYYPKEMKRAPEELLLKIWAKIMFLVNAPWDNPEYVNWSIWILKDVIWEWKNTKLVVELKDDNNIVKQLEIWMYTWRYVKTEIIWWQLVEEELWTYTQFPFHLAYAITIHKSQWLTFDKCQVDVANLFAWWQWYTALSRVRTLWWLRLFWRVDKNYLYFDEVAIDYSKYLIEKIKEDEIIDSGIIPDSWPELDPDAFVNTWEELTLDSDNLTEEEWDFSIIKWETVDARWKFVDNVVDKLWKFVVLKWSIWSEFITPSFASYKRNLFKRRNELIYDWVIEVRGDIIEFKENVEFNTATEASCFLQWISTWNFWDWKDDDWISINDLVWVDTTLKWEDAEKLKFLTDSQAKFFVWFPWEKLVFSKLTTLSASAANIISKYKWKYLWFPSLESLPENVALWLYDYKWKELDLSWLNTISLESFSYFKRCDCAYLNLSWLKNIDKELANSIWCTYFDHINLSWLQDISIDVAEKLSRFQWTLILKWLTSITMAQRWAFERNKRAVVFWNDIKNVKGSSYQISINKDNITDIDVNWLAKSHCFRVSINLKNAILNDRLCSFISKFRWCELSITWLNASEFYPELAKILARFEWKKLHVWITKWSFRYDTLRELIKFWWDYLIVSWFDELLDGQDEILLWFNWPRLWVRWNLSNKQRELFDEYEVTYSVNEDNWIDASQSTELNVSIDDSHNDISKIYLLEKDLITAKWKFLNLTSKDFVILAWSTWNKTHTFWFEASTLKDKYIELKKEWKIRVSWTKIIFDEDVVFSSPSYASSFLQWNTWGKVSDRKKL